MSNTVPVNYSKPKKTQTRFVLVWLTLAAVAVFLIAANRQNIYDWFRLYGYQPNGEIAQFVTDDTMTPYAKKVFYVNRPVVQDKTAFKASCPNGDKETAVLGCYIPDQRGIYVLSVTDSRLDGVEEVTAAHEMLHAAYDRLSSKQKEQVNGWLQDYYANGLTDESIRKQLESYKKSEPNDLVNEMHSIFGTQAANLPQQLEEYYKRYFTDRTAVVAQYQEYNGAFTSLKDQAAAILQQIKTLEKDIKQLESQLKSERQALENDRGDITTQAQANAFNKRVADYNQAVKSLQGLIDRHNTLVERYNSLQVSYNELVRDISSSQSTL
jgi:hypothetical protein